MADLEKRADGDEKPTDEQSTAEEQGTPVPHPPGAGPYPQLLHSQLMTPRAPLVPGAAMRIFPMRPPPVSSVPAVWAEDPTGRHQLRYWNGAIWTEHVADDGEVTADPMS